MRREAFQVSFSAVVVLYLTKKQHGHLTSEAKDPNKSSILRSISGVLAQSSKVSSRTYGISFPCLTCLAEQIVSGSIQDVIKDRTASYLCGMVLSLSLLPPY